MVICIGDDPSNSGIVGIFQIWEFLVGSLELGGYLTLKFGYMKIDNWSIMGCIMGCITH